MNKSDFQYLAETNILEQIYQKSNLQKQAGISDMLGGLTGPIMDWAKEHIDTSSVSSIIMSLADLMAPAVLFRINPALGILDSIATSLGFPVSAIVKKILSFVKGKLDSGTSFTLDEINSVGRAAVSSEAGDLTSENAYPLFELQKYAGLFDVFKFASLSKAKWILGAFVVWILKTILLGAGLVGSVDLVKHLIAPNSKSQTSDNDQPKEQSQNHTVSTEYPISTERSALEVSEPVHNLTSTGNGQDLHTNDGKTSTWYVPIVGGTIEAMLISWASYVYQELHNRGSVIASTPEFRSTVQTLRANLESGATNLKMPNKFKSIKQVVDQFASSVAQKLQDLK